jgi:hypothetical protein
MQVKGLGKHFCSMESWQFLYGGGYAFQTFWGALTSDPGALMLLGVGLWSMSRSAPVTPTAAAYASEPRVVVPTADADAAPTDETTLVARVNDQELDRSQLEQTLAADRAMADLFGQPLPDESTALDRLVNGELVWQAAPGVRVHAHCG